MLGINKVKPFGFIQQYNKEDIGSFENRLGTLPNDTKNFLKNYIIDPDFVKSKNEQSSISQLDSRDNIV